MKIFIKSSKNIAPLTIPYNSWSLTNFFDKKVIKAWKLTMKHSVINSQCRLLFGFSNLLGFSFQSHIKGKKIEKYVY